MEVAPTPSLEASLLSLSTRSAELAVWPTLSNLWLRKVLSTPKSKTCYSVGVPVTNTDPCFILPCRVCKDLLLL